MPRFWSRSIVSFRSTVYPHQPAGCGNCPDPNDTVMLWMASAALVSEYHLLLLSSEWVSIKRATERKSDNSKAVSKEQQEYCLFELKFVFLMTKLTMILTVNDPHDA